MFTDDATAIPPKRQHFARLLSKVFSLDALAPEGMMQLGIDLAKYRTPPRAIAYGAYTLDGWIKGQLLPTPKAFAAIEAACQARLGEMAMNHNEYQQLMGHLRSAYTAALQEQYPDDPEQARTTYKPTEVTHALRTVVQNEDLPVIQQQVAAATEQWIARERANGHEVSAIASHVPDISEIRRYLLGNTIRTPNRFLLQVIAEQYTALNPSIHAVLEQRLREVASDLWDEAVAKNNPGQLIYACRVRLGDTKPQFLDRFRDILDQQATPREHAALKQQVVAWEKAGRERTTPALCESLIEIMQAADRKSTTVENISLDRPWGHAHHFEPWFDKEKAALINVIFNGRKPEASLRPTSTIAGGTIDKGTIDKGVSATR